MNGMDVQLHGVTMRFGDFTAVQPTDLRIEAGEFFSFLGPSGCGKTTLLRIISGFIEPSSGQVLIGGQDMRGIGPNKRPTALIFQNLALFPLLKVWENIAFGLEVRGVGRRERRKRAEELLELIALPGQGDKQVAELSGGQRQRVAIARALAVEPAVLLLDEPLSALDLKLRQHMRAELRAIQKRTGVTFIYITHDQGEALTMSDRVAVMADGRILQTATPTQVYNEPATPFVATFVGESNVIPGTVRETDGDGALIETAFGLLRGRSPQPLSTGDAALLFVRPEGCKLGDGSDHANRLTARIERIDFEGIVSNIFLHADGGRPLMVQVHNSGAELGLKVGADCAVSFPASAARVLRRGEVAHD